LRPVLHTRDRARQRDGAGFTLIELMVTLAVVALLVAITVPSWNGFVGRAVVDAASGELAADLALARSESVRRQTAISVCAGALSGGAASCSGSGNWGNGRVVWCTDSSASGLCCPDGPGTCTAGLTQQVLKVRAAVNGGNVRVTGPASTLVFHPSGAVTSTVVPLTFTICKPASGGAYGALAARSLSLGMAGPLLAADTTLASCP